MEQKSLGDSSSYFEWLKKLWVPVAGLLGAITVIVQFIQLWRGDQETVTQVLWACGAILVCFSLYYIGFSRKASSIVITSKWGELTPRRIYTYGEKLSRIARVLLFFSLLGMIALWGLTIRRNNLLNNSVVVLIADFDGPDPKNYRVTEQLLSQLSNSLSGYGDTIITSLGETITEQEGSKAAQDLGKRYHADLVIWGWYGVTESNVLVTIHVENLSDLKYLPLKSSNLYGMQLPAYEIESFQIQQRLSSQMTALTLFLGGLIRYKANDYQGAINRLSEAIGEQWPDDLISKKYGFLYRGISYWWLAFDYNSSSNDDKAIADFSQAIEIDPEFWEAYYFRIMSYSSINEHSNAENDYQLFVSKAPPPTDLDGYWRYAILAIAVNDESKAVAYLSKIAENDPKNALALSNRASMYIVKGEHEKALGDVNRAIQLEPKFLLHYLNRANVYRVMKQDDLALKDINRALDLHTAKDEPKVNALILFDRGLIYMDMNNYSKALDDFSAAIQFSPDSYAYYHERGMAYFRLEEFELAARDFSTYLQNSGPHDWNRSYAYYYRGVAVDKLGYPVNALIDYSFAAQSYSYFAKSWHEGGYEDQAQGECKEAIQNFQELSDNSKNDSSMQWANSVVKAFQSACPNSLVERIPTKNWTVELATNPVVPGSGVAGIKIGDSVEYVIEHLGNAFSWFKLVGSDIPDCCLSGSWFSGDIMLNIFFSVTDKEAVDFYLDGTLTSSPSEFIPPVNGISIGASEEELLKNWGNPIYSGPTKTQAGCTVIYYDGIGFRTCGENKLINVIDIPGRLLKNR